MKISFYTIGCKLNQAETEDLKKSLHDIGYTIVPFNTRADISVVRACGVTCDASRTTREVIRQAKKNSSYVIAVGCVEDKKLPEIDSTAKNNEEVLSIIARRTSKTGCPPIDKMAKPQNCFSPPSLDCNDIKKTRSFIKIQDGCNFNCAYCIIPSFRGKTKSIAQDKILAKINEAVKDGSKEIILTGVNICLYKDGNCDLACLIAKIIKNTKIQRIRLGSIDPRLVSTKLINLFSNNRLMSHWHLSIQSGSDKVLKIMKRLYTAKRMLEIVAALRKKIPNFSFTTDIIVGFPGETDNDFQKTCDLIKKGLFSKTHIFPFSPRSGTLAHSLGQQIDEKTKKKRAQTLRLVAEQSRNEFLARHIINKTKPVLFEQKKGGYFSGYTPEYIRVRIKSDKNLANKLQMKKIIPSLLASQ